jgi:hypothetical protein
MERFWVDSGRYSYVYHFMAEYMRAHPGWGARAAAKRAAAKKFNITEDKAGDHHDRMLRSMKAAGVEVLLEEEIPMPVPSAAHRRQQQEDDAAQEQSENPAEFAFTPAERRMLRGVNKSFVTQLAQERLLARAAQVELTKLTQRKKK